VSVDGVDNTTHRSARGKNFKIVWQGLEAVQSAGKPVTVISVAHQGNYRELLALSELLAFSGPPPPAAFVSLRERAPSR
jgi:MoaA/NifB/PqqE/SkfB family radical SAM enzyme